MDSVVANNLSAVLKQACNYREPKVNQIKKNINEEFKAESDTNSTQESLKILEKNLSSD
jgi:hypothetical protein